MFLVGLFLGFSYSSAYKKKLDKEKPPFRDAEKY